MDVVPVEQLVLHNISKVPQAYVQFDPVSYSLTDESIEIPVIDLAAEAHQTIQHIRDACKEWGFFMVVNHGISNEVETMLAASAEFFNLPPEDKSDFLAETPATRYSATENVAVEWRDFLYMGKCNPLDKQTVSKWPQKPPSFRQASTRLCGSMNKLASKLLDFISLSLGLKHEAINEALGGGLQQSQLVNRYLPCPQPELVVALRSHSDPNAITLLVHNQVRGLQVLKDGSWVTVQCVPDSIIVNIGDQLEILSNGLYKSVEHRGLANSTATRYSIANFFKPATDEQVVQPLQELIIDQKRLYKSMSYKQYMEIYFAQKTLKNKATIFHAKLV